MDVQFAPLPHDTVLLVVTQLGVLLLTARLFGELAVRLRQPAVVGEILAGVVLGPSLLGGLFPDLARYWLPSVAGQSAPLETVSLIGVILLLVVTGFETDLGLIRRKSRTALSVAFGGFVVPFLGGLALGWSVPESLLTDADSRPIFALLLATALAVSAIPVLAALLLDLGMMRRDVGQTMLAAGMIDDIVGWTVLGVVISLAEGGGGAAAVLGTFATLAAFGIVSVGVGGPLVRRSIRFVHRASSTRHRFLTLALGLVFVWSAFSHALHLEPVIGAFTMGILLGRSKRLPSEAMAQIETLTMAVFAPIFFAVVGLKVDVSLLTSRQMALTTLAVLAVAILGKFLGSYAGGRWLGRTDRWTATAFGAGLTARGAIGIVVASVGQSLGILTPEFFSAIVLMAVVTSILAPAVMGRALRKIPMTADEALRLDAEHAHSGSMLGSGRRVLVPVRPRQEAGVHLLVKSALLSRLAESTQLAVTVMSVSDRSDRRAAEATTQRVGRSLGKRTDVSTRVVFGDPLETILAEAERGYDLMVVGASQPAEHPNSIYDTTVDELIRTSAVPTFVVSGAGADADWRPDVVLVPVDGSRASKRAAEVAVALADPSTMLVAMHVEAGPETTALSVSETYQLTRLESGMDLVAEVVRLGERRGVAVSTRIEASPVVGAAVVAAAAEVGASLIVMGTEARLATSRLTVGSTVRSVISNAPCPVAVLNS